MPPATEQAGSTSKARYIPYDSSKRSAKGKGAAAVDDSGSDWEPEQTAYSQSEDGDEPATPPPPTHDPNRVPEIEKKSAVHIHKLRAHQLNRLQPIRIVPDPKKPGKELTYYKLKDVIALASAKTYGSPIKEGKRNHIERMRNPTAADLMRRQRAIRRAKAANNAESSTQANTPTTERKSTVYIDLSDDDLL